MNVCRFVPCPSLAWLMLWINCWLLGSQPSSAADAASDLNLLRQRIVADLQVESSPPPATIETWLAKLTPAGRWSDIEYSSPRRTNWPAQEHANRISGLALAWANPQSPLRGDARLPSAAARAIVGWCRETPKCPNWWYNEIGVPLPLVKGLLLLGDQIPAGERTMPLPAMKKTWLAAKSSTTFTGQNLVWRAMIILYVACLTDDAALAEEALHHITSTLAVRADEGIQIDGSFHQHGPQLYSAGYGFAFSAMMSQLADECHGTRFAFQREHLDALAMMVLDGQQWFLQHGMFDHGAMGRNLTRPGSASVGKGLAEHARRLAAADPDRAARYMASAERSRDEPGAEPLLGNKVFWRSDMMVHRRPGWYASVKWESVRTIGSELVNGENLHGRHLADGLTCTWRSGKEYVDVYPLWDWRRLPGITAALTPKPPGGAAGRGLTAFAGGISDGNVGGVALDVDKDGVTARKAWFLADREIVCLGAGIASAGPDPVATTLDQRPLQGTPLVGQGSAAGESVKKPGSRVVTSPAWILHDGTGYLVPESDQQLTFSVERRSGEWKDISSEAVFPPVTMDVMSLWLNHGVKPVNASYHYILVPGTTATELATYAAHPGVQVLSNTKELQAVWCARQSSGFAAFYAPGRMDCGGGLVLTAHHPCLLLTRISGNEILLSLSDPTQQLTELSIASSLPVEGAGTVWDASTGQTQITVPLPTGLLAGKTVSVALRRK